MKLATTAVARETVCFIAFSPTILPKSYAEKFHGDIFHSSRLDGKEAKGKKVLIVGGLLVIESKSCPM
jgi:hypothetical protein